MNSAQPIRRLVATVVSTLFVAACSTLPVPVPAPTTPSIPHGHVPPIASPDDDVSEDATASDTAPAEDSLPTDAGSDAANNGRLWNALRASMRLPTFSDRADVQREIQNMRRDRSLPEILRTRGARWLPVIAAEARRHNLPGEVVMLAYIESKFDPGAVHAGNVGMWQIRAGTAEILGLQVGDGTNDERRDPLKSTAAAMEYLQRLTRLHGGDVMLALVAYNIGDGSLQRALDAAPNAKDIWALPLSAGARAHMARLAAMWSIVRTPHRYGIVLPNLGSAIAQSDAVRGESTRRPNALTPSARTTTSPIQTDPDTPTTPPARLAMSSELANNSTRLRTGNTRHAHARRTQYAVTHGDTLHAIAKRHGTTALALRHANNLASNLIHPGDRLTIPTKK